MSQSAMCYYKPNPALEPIAALRLSFSFAKEVEMPTAAPHMFNLEEAAIGYALAAEHMFRDDGAFLNANPAVVPIFVSMLFQSLEISIKHAGIDSGLFTIEEARSRQNRSGHGVKELAALAVEKLGGDPFDPIVMAMTFNNANSRSGTFLRKMIAAPEMEKTRESYTSRRLGYGQVAEGDFGLIQPIAEWIESIKQTAVGLPATIQILKTVEGVSFQVKALCNLDPAEMRRTRRLTRTRNPRRVSRRSPPPLGGKHIGKDNTGKVV